jgi:GLPGLI family protein|tara:strand:+ start:3548 stop:4267 length:720 start_codon:yes stop_codon:yes gene_type:complete
MNHFIKNISVILLILNINITLGQITHGVILYERKTNLLKKYKSPESRRWLRGEKVKIDRFNLHFSPEKSVFMPVESAVPSKADWATSKNTVLQNFDNNERVSIYNLFGDRKTVKDELVKRTWKITERKRNIAGYSCRRAIWSKNDSTRIYAWYTDQIIASTGPETFNGLPGTILGLATEDGGVVYFAKIVNEKYQNMDEIISDIKIKKTYTEKELKEELELKSKSNPWMGRIINYLFEW